MLDNNSKGGSEKPSPAGREFFFQKQPKQMKNKLQTAVQIRAFILRPFLPYPTTDY